MAVFLNMINKSNKNSRDILASIATQKIFNPKTKEVSCGASRRNSLLWFYVLGKTCFAIVFWLLGINQKLVLIKKRYYLKYIHNIHNW